MALTVSGIRAATLEVHVTTDDRELDRGLDTSEGKLRSFAGSAAKAGLIAAGAGAAAGVAFGVKAVQGASALEEQVSKTNVVFGNAASTVHEFTAGMARDFGIPKAQILDAASSIGLIGKASGLSQPAAATMSTQLAKLATDASSFYNVPLDEALMAIRSGLVGEAEPMRRFGVLLNEAAVQAEAVRLGLAAQGQELTEGMKAQARASLIMRGMTDASGDLERTQGSLANRLREVQGRAMNFAADVGTALMPAVLGAFDAFDSLGGKVSEFGGPILTEVTGGIRAFGAAWKANNGDITSSGFPGFMERVGFLGRQAFDILRQVIPPVLEDLRAFAGRVLPPLIDGFTAAAGGALAFVRNVGPPLVAALGPALGIVAALVDAFMPGLGQAIGAVLTVGGEIVGFLLTGLAPALSAVEWAIDAVAGAFDNPWLRGFGILVATILLPAFIAIGIQAGVTAAQVAAGWVVQTAASAASVGSQIANFVKIGIGWALIAGQAAAAALAVVAGWVAMAAASVANAVVIAAGWVIAFAPFILAAAVVAGVVYAIIQNWDTLKDAAAAVVGFVVDQFGNVLSFFGNMPGYIGRAVAGAATWLVNTGKNIIIGLVNGFHSITSWIWDAVNSIPSGIWRLVSGAGSWLVNTGKDIVTGLWNGIVGMGGWLFDKITGFISRNIPGPVKSVLGIFSPSRVMAGLGQDIAEGLVVGISSKTADVVRAASGMADAAIPGLPSGGWGGAAGAYVRPGDVGATMAAAGGNTYLDVTVAGNVLTERDLFDLFREWLIYTDRQNAGGVVAGYAS